MCQSYLRNSIVGNICVKLVSIDDLGTAGCILGNRGERNEGIVFANIQKVDIRLSTMYECVTDNVIRNLPVVCAAGGSSITVSGVSLLITLPRNALSFEQVYDISAVNSGVKIEENTASGSTNHGHLSIEQAIFKKKLLCLAIFSRSHD